MIAGVDLQVGWEFDLVVGLPIVLILFVAFIVWASTRRPL